MRRVCLHEVFYRRIIIVSWNTNAARVHDQLSTRKLDHSSNVRVPAQDHRFSDNAEKFHDGVLYSNNWMSRTYVFEKVSRVTRWCAVTEKHPPLHHGSGRQAAQPSDRLTTEVSCNESESLVCSEVVRAGFENLPILVSRDACDHVRPLKNPVSF